MQKENLGYSLKVKTVTVDDGTLYIAKYEELEGCVGEGPTEEEAIKELNVNAEMWLDVRKEHGLAIPKCKNI